MNFHLIDTHVIHARLDSDRHFWGLAPWVAVFDGYDGAPIDYDTPSRDPIGEGYTEQEAIDDLLEKIE